MYSAAAPASRGLADLALTLAHRVPDLAQVMAAIEEAREGATLDRG